MHEDVIIERDPRLHERNVQEIKDFLEERRDRNSSARANTGFPERGDGYHAPRVLGRPDRSYDEPTLGRRPPPPANYYSQRSRDSVVIHRPRSITTIRSPVREYEPLHPDPANNYLEDSFRQRMGSRSDKRVGIIVPRPRSHERPDRRNHTYDEREWALVPSRQPVPDSRESWSSEEGEDLPKSASDDGRVQGEAHQTDEAIIASTLKRFTTFRRDEEPSLGPPSPPRQNTQDDDSTVAHLPAHVGIDVDGNGPKLFEHIEQRVVLYAEPGKLADNEADSAGIPPPPRKPSKQALKKKLSNGPTVVTESEDDETEYQIRTEPKKQKKRKKKTEVRVRPAATGLSDGQDGESSDVVDMMGQEENGSGTVASSPLRSGSPSLTER